MPSHIFRLASSQTAGTGNPFNHSFTVVTGDTVLIVPLFVGSGTSRTGGAVTYAGQDMTQAGTEQKAAASPEVVVEMWYMINPPVGTANISAPNAGALNLRIVGVAAQSAAGSEFNAAGGANGTSTNPTSTITTTKDDCFIVAILGGGHTNITTGTPGMANEIWETDHGAVGSTGAWAYGAIAGVHDTSWTNGTSDDWAICSVAIAPAKNPVNFNNYLGVRASSGMSVGEKIR